MATVRSLGVRTDDIVFTIVQSESNYDIFPSSLVGTPINHIRFDVSASAFIDASANTQWYISDDGVKHYNQIVSTWQLVSAHIDASLIVDASSGLWRLENPNEVMDEYAKKVKNNIRTLAENYSQSEYSLRTRFQDEPLALWYDFFVISNADPNTYTTVSAIGSGTVDVATRYYFKEIRDKARRVYLEIETLTNVESNKPDGTINWSRVISQGVIGWWYKDINALKNAETSKINGATVFSALTSYAAGDLVFNMTSKLFMVNSSSHISASTIAQDASYWSTYSPGNIVWTPFPRSQLNS